MTHVLGKRTACRSWLFPLILKILEIELKLLSLVASLPAETFYHHETEF